MVVNKNQQLMFALLRKPKIKWAFVLLILLLPLFSIAQDLNKKVSVNYVNKPLGQVLNEISGLGNINFSYSPQTIPVNKLITIKAKNKSIKKILDEVLVKNGISYFPVENQIIIKPQKTEPVQTNEDKPKQKNKFTISGYLKDKTNGEILIGSTVYANGTSMGTASNAYGYYSLTLPEGSYEIVYSFIGYEKTSQKIDLKENKNISVEMQTANSKINEVEIVADTQEPEVRNNQLGQIKLTPKAISQLPGFMGDVDIIKALQAIPGFKTYGDGSTMFYVRGGNSDQNFILIDEAPIYNPSHLFGFFTAIAPDAIKDAEVYKGDCPASYGGRLSSVIDMKMKDGNMKKFGGGGSLGLFTTSLTFEGPFKKEKASFFISMRKSNLNWVRQSQSLINPFKLNFYDFNTKFNWKLNHNNRLFLTLYKGNDEIFRQGLLLSRTSGISWDNALGTLRWNHLFGNKLFSNTTFYYSKYNYYLYIYKESNDYWKSSINNSTIKTDFSYFPNPKNTIRTGIELNSHTSDPGNLYLSDNNLQIHIPTIPQYSSGEFCFYLSNEQKIGNKFAARYGVRVPVWKNKGATKYYSFDENYNVIDTTIIVDKQVYSTFKGFEPRINLSYALTTKSSLKASYNRATQFVQLLTNSVSPFTSLEAWAPSGPNIKPQKADQVALGYFQELFKSKITFSVEAYYKKLYHQIDYVDHANMLFNPLIEGELRFGYAKSYGVETMIKKTEGNFTAWLGYTYSRVFKKINDVNNGNLFPASYDRPNDISVNITYNTKNKRWNFAANWVYLTGGAITTPVGFFYYNGYSVPIYGDKNNDRLPDYHRLDIAITLKLNKTEKRYQHSLVFALYNAYGRKNPISVSFNKIMDDNGNFVIPTNVYGQYEVVPSTLSVAGVIPSLSHNFKF